MRRLAYMIIGLCLFVACREQKEHTAPAITDRDSVAMMTSYGVNTLISDSGVIKYRIVAERWEVNQKRNPSRWIFEKGVFLEQFDENLHVLSYIQCDTANYYDQKRLWELHGRVRILTKDGIRYTSEQLYWDESKHELYSHTWSKLVTPERTLEGRYFRSDEKMNRYYVSNSSGSFERGDLTGEDKEENKADTSRTIMRQQAMPQRASQP
ncbi:MAG: LPS export ABC transporter periplasmic protein LptC [Prevotella sp.]|nr:LPS export ABC transporter periplasmic protein LptC [Prevotella sp.]